jgi:hypothetical protein
MNGSVPPHAGDAPRIPSASDPPQLRPWPADLRQTMPPWRPGSRFRAIAPSSTFVRSAGCLSFSAIVRNACPPALRFLVCHPRRAGSATKRKRDDLSPLPKLSHMPQWSRFSPSIFAATALLAGCGFVHDGRLDGPYRLIAVDADSEMSVCYDLGDGNCIGRISDQKVRDRTRESLAPRRPRAVTKVQQIRLFCRTLDCARAF